MLKKFKKKSFFKNKKKNENRGYILARYKQGIKPNEIFKELKIAFGDASPSYTTVTRWVNRFKVESEDLEDENRSGRPIAGTITSNKGYKRSN